MSAQGSDFDEKRCHRHGIFEEDDSEVTRRMAAPPNGQRQRPGADETSADSTESVRMPAALAGGTPEVPWRPNRRKSRDSA